MLAAGEAGAAGATDGSDPERDAGGQASGGRRATGTGAGAAAAPPAPHHSVPDVREEGLGGEVHLTELPSMEDESRIRQANAGGPGKQCLMGAQHE